MGKTIQMKMIDYIDQKIIVVVTGFCFFGILIKDNKILDQSEIINSHSEFLDF